MTLLLRVFARCVAAMSFSLALPALAQPSAERRHLSGRTEADAGMEATETLAAYDKTRDPAMLRQAGDQVMAGDAAAAPPEAQLGLWLSILSRFRRDLDTSFDPAQPLR